MTTSAATLASMRDRLEAALMDSSNLVWDTTTLDEALRRALAEISTAWGEPLTLSGLDSALVTTVQAEDESALVTGGEYYALSSRAVDRLEMPNLNEDVPRQFSAWAGQAGARFASALEKTRRRRLQRSPAAPSSTLEWDERDPAW